MSKINTCANKITRVATPQPAATLRQTARNGVFSVNNLLSHVFSKILWKKKTWDVSLRRWLPRVFTAKSPSGHPGNGPMRTLAVTRIRVTWPDENFCCHSNTGDTAVNVLIRRNTRKKCTVQENIYYVLTLNFFVLFGSSTNFLSLICHTITFYFDYSTKFLLRHAMSKKSLYVEVRVQRMRRTGYTIRTTQ